MWIITRDAYEKKDIRVMSCNYKEGKALPFRFRLKDDDGNIYYYGQSSSDSSFAPLDDFGGPNVGCTSIEYWDKVNRCWEIL